MSTVTKRRPGLWPKFTIPVITPNNNYIDLLEVELLAFDSYKLKVDGVTALADGSTLNDWYQNDSLSKDQIWTLAVASGKKVISISKLNVQLALTSLGLPDTYNRGRFYSNIIAEYKSASGDVNKGGIIEFGILSPSGEVIYLGGTDEAPSYDDPSGTSLTRIMTFGTYLLRARLVGAQEGTAPSEYFYSKTQSFNDWFPTDLGADLLEFAFVKHVSGSLIMQDYAGNTVVGGSIILEQGRLMHYLNAQNPSGLNSGSVGNITKEIIIAVAGKSFGATPMRFKGNSNYVAAGLNLFPTKITKDNSTALITLSQSTDFWTFTSDGYFISIIVLNTNKTATLASGPKWTKGVSDSNAIITAGVKAYTNKNGESQLQTVENGALTVTADAVASVGWDGALFTGNFASTQKTSIIIMGLKTTFSAQDISNFFGFLKKKVRP